MPEGLSVSQNLAREDWDSLSMLLGKIDLSDIQSKSLKRKTYFVKNILHLQMRQLNGSGTVNASILVGALKTLFSLENEFRGQDHDFLVFLKMLVYKMETQKLRVNKVLEKQLEFKRMKGVVEL